MTTRRLYSLVSLVAVAAVCAIGAPLTAQQGGRGNQPPTATDRLAPPKLVKLPPAHSRDPSADSAWGT